MRARRRRLVEACKPLTVDGIAGLIAHLPDRAGARNLNRIEDGPMRQGLRPSPPRG
jgi:hypothetical protein